jgi:hypothetical protein
MKDRVALEPGAGKSCYAVGNESRTPLSTRVLGDYDRRRLRWWLPRTMGDDAETWRVVDFFYPVRGETIPTFKTIVTGARRSLPKLISLVCRMGLKAGGLAGLSTSPFSCSLVAPVVVNG